MDSPVDVSLFQDKFRIILVTYTLRTVELHGGTTNSSSSYTDSEASSWYASNDGAANRKSEVNLIPIEAIDDLRRIAERMIAAGYSRQCLEVYASERKLGLEHQILKKLEIEKLSSKHIQRLEWKVQEEKIGRWINAATVCLRVLFPAERRLSEQIFEGLGTDKIDDACYTETIKDSVVQLLDFVEAICGSRRSPEKLFKILDLYKVVSKLFLLPSIGGRSGNFMRKQVEKVLSSLSKAAREMLSEFEKTVVGEISSPVPGEPVQRVTTYVMWYIQRMTTLHEQTLMELIVSKPSAHSTGKLGFDCRPEFREIEASSPPLAFHLVWIIVALKFNLEGKSKQFNDDYLAHQFMMDNIDYIEEKIKESVKMREMIGDAYDAAYLVKLIRRFRLSAEKSPTWRRRIFGCIA